MPGSTGAQELAGYLRELKGRTGRSYDTLAGRLSISRSALHRYCSGESVPPQLEVVERFARECGAGPREIVELRRL